VTGAVLDESDDEDVEYKGHFCSECSISVYSSSWGCAGVGSWVCDGVGLWEAGSGCACCEDYD